MKKKEKNISYLIKSNNYVGLLFFALVFASVLYIIKNNTQELKPIEIDEEIKAIEPVSKDNETDEIKYLRSYLNPGDGNTYRIYQSNYNKEEVTSTSFDQDSLLYMAYNYLITINDYTQTRNLTCEEATLIGLDTEIIECNGTNQNINNYQVIYSITKQLLKNTIIDLYGINITNFNSFYPTYSNVCHYINDEYLCIKNTQNKEENSNKGFTTFIEAIYEENKISIIENYQYKVDNTPYKTFQGNEVGEQLYISTFQKVNGRYIYISTKPYEKN